MKDVGLAEADLPRVFRPFYTGQNGRQTGEATGNRTLLSRNDQQAIGFRYRFGL